MGRSVSGNQPGGQRLITWVKSNHSLPFYGWLRFRWFFVVVIAIIISFKMDDSAKLDVKFCKPSNFLFASPTRLKVIQLAKSVTK